MANGITDPRKKRKKRKKENYGKNIKSLLNKPRANPTIVSFNATSSLVRLKSEDIFSN
jgi:hypothetical protein